jgi:hypothetical protein
MSDATGISIGTPVVLRERSNPWFCFRPGTGTDIVFKVSDVKMRIVRTQRGTESDICGVGIYGALHVIYTNQHPDGYFETPTYTGQFIDSAGEAIPGLPIWDWGAMTMLCPLSGQDFGKGRQTRVDPKFFTQIDDMTLACSSVNWWPCP